MAAQRPGIKKNTWFGILVAMLKGVAHLPFWILYRLSDLTFLLMCYVVRYRRAVIDKNLSESFPELPANERARIRRRFYRNFTDYIFETIKLLHVSDSQMRRRMTFSV